MADKTKGKTRHITFPKPSKSADEKVALTLRVDRDLYRRLATYAVSGESLMTHQDVLETALTEFLDRHKA